MLPLESGAFPAHRHLAFLVFSCVANVYARDEDRFFDEGPYPPSDPFYSDSPLFALLSPHLQLKLLSDLARWLLVGGGPEKLSLGHLAALWAALALYNAPLSVEGDEAPAHEAPAPWVRKPGLPPPTMEEYIALTSLQRRLGSMHEAAAVVLAEGGDLQAQGLADLPPVPPTPEHFYAQRRLEYAQLPPSGLAGLVPSSGNPRPGCAPALCAPWNLHRHALVSAFTEYVQALPGGRRVSQLSVNADTCTTRDLDFMLDACFSLMSGWQEGESELLRGCCSAEQVGRLRRLQSTASQLNAAFAAALEHDPALLARAYSQLTVLTVHGTRHSQRVAAAAMQAGCSAYSAQLTAWVAADAAKGIDTHQAYEGRFPSAHQLSVPMQEQEGHRRLQYLLSVAQKAAELVAEGHTERELRECVAEWRAAWASGSGSGSGSGGGGGVDGGDGSGGASASSASEESSSSSSSSKKDVDALVRAACNDVLGKMLEDSDRNRTRGLKFLRFERMLGEYHAIMHSRHGGGQGGALEAAHAASAPLERAYASFQERLAAAAQLLHPVAPAWLELTSPQEWLQRKHSNVVAQGLNCDSCNQVRTVEELLACSACKVTRYCGIECQRSHWRGGHKAECALMRGGGGGAVAAGSN